MVYTVVKNFVLMFVFQERRINLKRIYEVGVVLEPENSTHESRH